MNPPFGTEGGVSLQGLFSDRCMSEYKASNVTQAVLILKAAVGYGWFRPVYSLPHCWLYERVKFVKGEATGHCAAPMEQGVTKQVTHGLTWGHKRVANPHGSVVVYIGPQAHRFARLFSSIGSIPGSHAWSLPLPEEGP
jgi:hypothetical protein